MLVLEIEWLRGVAVLSRDPSDPAPDWPPHPDRIFSALVASWGARGEAGDERAALEWLERQPPPRLEACAAHPRDTVTVYVPVNDTVGTVSPQPEARPRQPRRFPTAGLNSPQQEGNCHHLHVVWSAKPDTSTFAALDALARDTSYVGHSSSLVRCRFSCPQSAPVRVDQWSQSARVRAPYSGRIAELTRIHERHVGGDERARAKPSSRMSRNAQLQAAVVRSVLSPEWIVLSHVGGERPEALAAAPIAKRMREALMSVWPEKPPTWLCGHEADGSPAREPHLAVLPLCDVGHDWSDGHLMGLALVPPRTLAERWEQQAPFAWQEKRALPNALASLGAMSHRNKEEDDTIRLELGRAGTWDIAVDEARVARALRPQRYCRPARRFATVTPIALDRHPKGDHIERSEEAKRLVGLACTRIDLPEPSVVALSKHSALRGAISARAPSGAPAWATWARPGTLAGKALVHAVIEFAAPVEGPVVLGAGRYHGLGLFLPIGEAP